MSGEGARSGLAAVLVGLSLRRSRVRPRAGLGNVGRFKHGPGGDS